jgi:hypothetical protein
LPPIFFITIQHVICGYEKIGVKIYGVVCDAGGSNRGLFKLLRDGLKLVIVGVERVAPGYVKFINPYDPSREIAIFNCSTHNLKNVRNALLESDLPNGKRKFQFEGAVFGWKHIRETYDRDCERENANTVKETLQENFEPLIQLLDGMRCFHHHAIIDPEYMKNCYSHTDQSRNGGWLSLVSKEFFVSVLKSLMDRLVLKTFHARAGASMDAWKRKNTAREVKGSTDASFRADLKSKVSQTTKKAGEFQIRKRGGNMLSQTIAGVAKKDKPTPKPKPTEEETEVHN